MNQKSKENTLLGFVMAAALIGTSLAAYKNSKDGYVFDFRSNGNKTLIEPVSMPDTVALKAYYQ